MSDTRVPPALAAAVAANLRPVRPLASPWRRALALLPLGIALLVGMPAFWSWRSHIDVFAPWPWRALSPLETIAGLLVLAAAFREAVPGRELSARALWALLGAAGATFLSINLVSAASVDVAPATALRWLRDCFAMAIAFSGPTLLLPAWLVSRALPNRPALTGALCGLGVGFMADAGLRALCWDGEHAHILIAHGGAIAMLMALGAAGTTVVERIRR